MDIFPERKKTWLTDNHYRRELIAKYEKELEAKRTK